MTKRVAVLTSGGDAPGMNAAIRAVVRCAVDRGFEALGVRHGFAGLLGGHFVPLGPRDVGGVVQAGGTFLGSARSAEFRAPEGQRKALAELERGAVSALVVIGGNGSQAGAHALSVAGFPVVGVASTIDNDLVGSDITIGVDTALDVALEAIDRLRTTAASHERAFLIEVMGRGSGYLALMSGIAGGAEAVVVPERELAPADVAAELRAAHARGKSHGIVVVAEGAAHGCDAIAEHLRGQDVGYEVRVTKLGHVQRGGAPGAFDRLLATRLGAGAVERLARGEHGVLVGLRGNAVAATPLADVAGRTKPLDLHLLELAQTLAR